MYPFFSGTPMFLGSYSWGPHSKLEAFQIRAYGKALVDGQSPWGQIRPGSMPPTLIYNIEFPIPVIFEVGEFL